MKRKWTDKQLGEAVSASSTYRELMERLGLKKDSTGGSRSLIKKHIRRLSLDTSHFDLSGRKGKIKEEQRRRSLEKWMVEDSPSYASATLKKYLIDAGMLDNHCYECGQVPEWNHKPLVLQIDHINGNHSDNRLPNLRILCPNCHTQTDTYVSKNRRNRA